MPIAQMSFTPLSGVADTSYGESNLGSKYYGAMKPQASQYYKNFLKNQDWIDFKPVRKAKAKPASKPAPKKPVVKKQKNGAQKVGVKKRKR